ncbi:MAG: protein phosphatase 2C domain-containing protein [Mycoplasmataceae bacterium]|nr:protein phosphatase 2C domain-containing protein [Mycoplasmataceae bacterium]
MKINTSTLISAYSEKGRRERNEDFYVSAYNKSNQLLVVVCDGIGGDDDSQVASRLLANNFLIGFKKKKKIHNFSWFYNHILKKASRDITKHTKNGKVMGTTICVVLVTGNLVETANMGDTRIFYFSYEQNVWKQISFDHNLNNMLRMQFDSQRKKNPSLITEINNAEKKAFDVNRDHLLSLTNCIESFKKPKTHDSYYKSFTANASDIIHICSDGVYNWVKNNDIIQIINNNTSKFSQCAKDIVETAYKQDSNDNMTSFVIKFTDGKN